MLKVATPDDGNVADMVPHPVRRLDSRMTGEEMLSEAAASMLRADDLYGLMETFTQIESFAMQAAGFFTHLFPSTSRDHASALSEILDAGVLAYLRREEGGTPSSQVAAFMASALQAATYVLTHYEVTLVGNPSKPWNPWKDHGLAVQSERPLVLLFRPALAPDAEKRHAARMLLQHELLTYGDVMAIHRAGIDLLTGELF